MGGNISPEVLQDLALNDSWEKAREDKLYQLGAKMVADKTLRETALLLSNNPIKE